MRAGAAESARSERPPRTRRFLITLVITAGLGGFVVFGLQPFLSPTQPVAATCLVVEGWLPYPAMARAVQEFRGGGYERIFTIGIPFRSFEGPDASGSVANSGAGKLRKLGIPAEAVIAVPAKPAIRNRTFESALALREYCAANSLKLGSVNVISIGTHGRRSWLCVRRALGKGVRVGIISVEDPSYDPRRWWKYSEGVKEVFGEALACAYAWLTIDYGK